MTSSALCPTNCQSSTKVHVDRLGWELLITAENAKLTKNIPTTLSGSPSGRPHVAWTLRLTPPSTLKRLWRDVTAWHQGRINPLGSPNFRPKYQIGILGNELKHLVISAIIPTTSWLYHWPSSIWSATSNHKLAVSFFGLDPKSSAGANWTNHWSACFALNDAHTRYNKLITQMGLKAAGVEADSTFSKDDINAVIHAWGHGLPCSIWPIKSTSDCLHWYGKFKRSSLEIPSGPVAVRVFFPPHDIIPILDCDFGVRHCVRRRWKDLFTLIYKRWPCLILKITMLSPPLSPKIFKRLKDFFSASNPLFLTKNCAYLKRDGLCKIQLVRRNDLAI